MALVGEAAEAADADLERCRELAAQAAQRWPDCVDAYNLLGQCASSPLQGASYYRQAMDAFGRTFDDDAFAQAVGHFWGVVETRPYMRAQAGLADCMLRLDLYREAAVNWRSMLELNPNDNQGVRLLLAPVLLLLGQPADLAQLDALLDKYDDDAMAVLQYCRALLCHRLGRASAGGRLDQAISANPYFVPYLLGKRRPPRDPPETHGLGDEDEARCYAGSLVEPWRETPGAPGWLADRFAKHREATADLDLDEEFDGDGDELDEGLDEGLDDFEDVDVHFGRDEGRRASREAASAQAKVLPFVAPARRQEPEGVADEAEPAPVSLAAVVDEMQVVSDDVCAFIDRRTGGFVTVIGGEVYSDEQDGADGADPLDPEDLDAEHYVGLPDRFEINEWDIMKRFSLERHSDAQRDALLDAIHGTGAFRMFRSTVDRFDIRDEWDRYRQEALIEIARDWLEANQIPYTTP